MAPPAPAPRDRALERPSGRGLRIRQFNPATMLRDCATCAVIGMRGTGKSVLIKDIMSHVKHIPWGLVFSGTEDGNGWYEQFVPDSLIYNDYYPEVLDDLIEHKRREKNEAKVKFKNGAIAEVPKKKTFLVMDDCLYDTRVLKTEAMRFVFMNGRHYDIFSIIAAQWLYDVPPAMRNNIDYVFVLRDVNAQTRVKLWKSFFGIVPSLETFNTIMDECTRDHRCMVLCTTPQTNVDNPGIADHLFWYKASMDHAGLRVCSREVWETHHSKYDPEYYAKRDRSLAAPGGGRGRAATRVRAVESDRKKRKRRR